MFHERDMSLHPCNGKSRQTSVYLPALQKIYQVVVGCQFRKTRILFHEGTFFMISDAIQINRLNQAIYKFLSAFLERNPDPGWIIQSILQSLEIRFLFTDKAYIIWAIPYSLYDIGLRSPFGSQVITEILIWTETEVYRK